jgi:hypothetical protein
MADQRNAKPAPGAMSPPESANPGRHRQSQIFERETRPLAPQGPGEDVPPEDLRGVGQAPGPDTSGAVARPAEANRPGASTKLGGTPGANAMQSGGRDTDY